MMTAAHGKKLSLWQRLAEELRKYVALSAYLFICFGALAYLKSAILRAHGIEFAPWAFAAVKAVVLAKFILIGGALGIGDRYTNKHPLILPILHRSLAALAAVGILTIIEEIAIARLRGRTVFDALAEIRGGTSHQLIASMIIMWLVLIPYFGYLSLGDIFGHDNLRRLFLESRIRKSSVNKPSARPVPVGNQIRSA